MSNQFEHRVLLHQTRSHGRPSISYFASAHPLHVASRTRASRAPAQAYELARLAPTSANSSPARFVFLTTQAPKHASSQFWRPAMSTRPWPLPSRHRGLDTEFHENLPKLFPQADMRSYFIGNQALIDQTAFRNSSLQAAYFILAARALAWIADQCRLRRRQTQCGILS